MLSCEIHLYHQREKNPSSHLVRSMQRSEREAPVKCFFLWLKARRLADEEGDSFRRSDSSAESCLRDYIFFLFKLVLGRPWSCLFHPFLKVDKQVKCRAADSQAVEKIGCDTSPSRAATQLHPPSKVRRVKGFSLTLEPPTFGRLVQAQNPSNPTIHRSFFVFAGHRPERRFHLGLRVSWHYSSTTWPSLCSKRLWLTWESRLSKDAMKQYQQQKDTKLPEDALCFWNSFLLFGLVLVDSARACGVAKPKAGNPKMSKPWGRNRQIPNPKNPLSTHSFYWHFGIFLHFSNLRQNARKTTPNPTKSKIISKCT